MPGGLVYHWKHGWIPLDHIAALSKAHGSKSGAARVMAKHGIAAPREGGNAAGTPHPEPHRLRVGEHATVKGTDSSGHPLTLTGHVVGNSETSRFKPGRTTGGEPLRAISIKRQGASGLDRVDPVFVPDPARGPVRRQSNRQALDAARAASVPTITANGVTGAVGNMFDVSALRAAHAAKQGGVGMPPKKSGKYTLERTLPDGTVKTHSMAMTPREAAVAAGHSLHDNGAASKADAQRTGKALESHPVGVHLPAPGGYKFRLLPR